MPEKSGERLAVVRAVVIDWAEVQCLYPILVVIDWAEVQCLYPILSH